MTDDTLRVAAFAIRALWYGVPMPIGAPTFEAMAAAALNQSPEPTESQPYTTGVSESGSAGGVTQRPVVSGDMVMVERADVQALLDDLNQHIERDIRIAIWNVGMFGGMGQELLQEFIRRAMEEPCMKRALAALSTEAVPVERDRAISSIHLALARIDPGTRVSSLTYDEVDSLVDAVLNPSLGGGGR